jgi:hypothetical protein
MPYCAVTYPHSARPYTFYTNRKDIAQGADVIVKDVKGFSLCKFISYVEKPSFTCNVVVTTRLDLEEIADQARADMEAEAESEDLDESA